MKLNWFLRIWHLTCSTVLFKRLETVTHNKRLHILSTVLILLIVDLALVYRHSGHARVICSSETTQCL